MLAHTDPPPRKEKCHVERGKYPNETRKTNATDAESAPQHQVLSRWLVSVFVRAALIRTVDDPRGANTDGDGKAERELQHAGGVIQRGSHCRERKHGDRERQCAHANDRAARAYRPLDQARELRLGGVLNAPFVAPAIPIAVHRRLTHASNSRSRSRARLRRTDTLFSVTFSTAAISGTAQPSRRS